MTRILKYKIGEFTTEVIRLPKDAKILSVQYQKGVLCLWAMGDASEMEDRVIEIYGTGWEIGADKSKGGTLKYIATVQNDQQDLVWHVFERVATVYY